MRKEASGHVAGSKRASRSSAVHSSSTVKRASSECDSEKRKKPVGVSSAPLPLAVVVVEVQRGKSSVGVDSKVKKKSVTLKTLPVKKIPSSRKISGDSSELKGRQMKPKKDVVSTKSVKLKTKKVDKNKKAVKDENKKKLIKNPKKQQKKIVFPDDTPNSPVTVVITEPEAVQSNQTGKKPKLLKKQNTLPSKKLSVTSGKIGKRKDKIVKMVSAKQVRKVVKKEVCQKPGVDSLSIDVNEDIIQVAKKGSPNRKTKTSEKMELPPKSPIAVNRDLSPSNTSENKNSSAVKNISKPVGSEKKVATKKKQSKPPEEQAKKSKSEIQNGEMKDSASDLVISKPETKKKVVHKVVKKLKSVTDSKISQKVASEGKVPKPKAENKKAVSKKTSSQAGKSKPKTSQIKSKKAMKSESSDKGSDSNSEKHSNTLMENSNDSSTSDEIPLGMLKKQRICKAEPISENESKVEITDHQKVYEDKVKVEDSSVKIKKEIVSEVSSAGTSPDSEENQKISDVKKEVAKDAFVGNKKTVKQLKNADIPKKLVEKKTKKEPITKPKCTVKVGVKGKKPEETKARKNKKKPTKSDDDSVKGNSKKPRKDNGSDSEKRARRMRLFGFWSGPKRHRVASLNALAKVHCLYENESRHIQLEIPNDPPSAQKQSSSKKSEPKLKPEKVEPDPECLASTRTLRSAPGLRSVGRHYDVMNASSTTTTLSSSEDSSDSVEHKKLQLQPSFKQKPKVQSSDNTSEEEDRLEAAKKKSGSASENGGEGTGRKVKKRRKRNELMMDLKDMVVRKRMASLNASAMLAASYSLEKRSSSSSGTRRDDSEEDSSSRGKTQRKRKCKTSSESSPDMEVEDSSCEEDVLIRGGGSKQKVAVILNQDTDVTITGVYVNSTTRSTHHEGFCSIAGMQYRISSTSHTQTEATAVATETVLHADHAAREPASGAPVVASPCKSYTPLGALSNMQPPGQQRPRAGPPSPLARRHSCTSAFSAPPTQQDPAYAHGYYQPAGPLISHHHHHHSSTSSSVTSKAPPPAALQTPTPPPSSAPQPVSESSDSEVVISTSSSEPNPPPPPPPPVTYQYAGQPPYPPYNYQYYPSPPATASLQYPGAQQSHHQYHQEVCYTTPSNYPPTYFHHKASPYPPHAYHRRYVPPPRYYPQDFYSNPSNPTAPPPPPAPSQQQMIVTAPPPPAGAPTSTYPPPESSYPPPPAPIVEGTYPPPPPPPTYYPPYSAGPPPPCYTHSPPSRSLFIDAAYQGCPCPMQSCPKNVHTGPLTGASKGSLKNHQSTTPLPPVALALPLEPPGAVGPPSPARGSAGMPPPPSPALATARNPPMQWNDSPPSKSSDMGLLAIGKVFSESLSVEEPEADSVESTLINLTLPKTENVKVEIEETPYTHEVVEIKPARKRRKLLSEARRQSVESIVSEIIQIKCQPDLQERLTASNCEVITQVPVDMVVSSDKQLPLTDCTVTNTSVPVVKKQPLKRKLSVNENSQPVNAVKCAKKKKLENSASKKKLSAKIKEEMAEENIAPVIVETAKVTKRRRSSKVIERRKSCSNESPIRENTPVIPSSQIIDDPQPKKICRSRKSQEKNVVSRPQTTKAKKPSKNITAVKGGTKKEVGSQKLLANTMPAISGKKQQQASNSIVNNNNNNINSNNNNNSPELTPERAQIVSLRKSQLTLKWSNGWSWEGTPFKSKVFLTSDDAPVIRKCYSAMRHVEGDVICPRDCVLLKSGPRKIDLPFVAKVAAMWENPDDGEMTLSLLWYYRPEHTDRGRRPEDNIDEIFASRHKDINSVACVEDKCFVLTFNEYCRYRKNVRRGEEGLTAPSRIVPIPDGSSYPRINRQPPGQVAPDLVFFCRKVYDFRQRRLLKNPS